MKWFRDLYDRRIRLTEERQEHIEVDHPEMHGQLKRIKETLSKPDIIVKSKTDSSVELFYRHYNHTPVTEKYLCVVVKILIGIYYNFILYRYSEER